MIQNSIAKLGRIEHDLDEGIYHVIEVTKEGYVLKEYQNVFLNKTLEL